MSIKNVTIYPYSNYTVSDIDFILNFISDINIKHLVSPTGLGLNNKDAGFADNRKDLNIIVENDFENALNDCDTVFFMDHKIEYLLKESIISKIKLSIEKRKNIYCAIELSEQELTQFNDMSSQYNSNFYYFDRKPKIDFEVSHRMRLFQPKIPVIFFGDLFNQGYSYEVMLKLAGLLKDNNTKASVISEGKNSCFYGFHCLPDFLYSNNISEEDKIYNLNYYIRSIIDDEKPEILLLQLPSGLIKFNDVFTNHFGIMAYIVAQSLQPDYFFLSAPYQTANEEYYEVISNNIKYKYNSAVSCINVSNILFDLHDTYKVGTVKITRISMQHVENEIQQYTNFKMSFINIQNVSKQNGNMNILNDVFKNL